MFLAASSQCFSDHSFADACDRLSDLEFDKLEIWVDEQSDHLKPSELATDPDRFVSRYREVTRLTPLAIHLQHDVPIETFQGITQVAKLLRITQITVPASPVGTPFNMEVDRLRAMLQVSENEGVRVSIKTDSATLARDPDTAVELCGAARGLGITLDPSYYICTPEKISGYDQVFPHVYHLHLRDTTPDELQVQIGLGEVDFSRIFPALERENYNRALSVCLFPGTDPLETRLLELRKMRRLIETFL